MNDSKMIDYSQYNISITPYTTGGSIEVDDRCNGFTAVNVGDDTAFVNGFPLFPGTPGTVIGDAFGIGGNKDELYKGNIMLSFAGVGVAPQVIIMQKFYIKDYRAMRGPKS